MPYRLVIFDFDGTLADSFPWFLQVVNSVADTYRFNPILPDQVETLRGYNARQLVRHLGVPWWKVPLIGRHMRQLAATGIGQIPLFDGVDQVVHALTEAGVTLALVTSNSYDNVRRVLGPANAARITYYECGVSLFGKRARFQRILKQRGLFPHEALCVGDELRDLEAAANARIPFGAVSWGFTRPEALAAAHPTITFTRMEQIIDYVLGHPAQERGTQPLV